MNILKLLSRKKEIKMQKSANVYIFMFALRHNTHSHASADFLHTD